MLAFSSTSFNDLLKDFSQTSKTKVAIGYVLMVRHESVSRYEHSWCRVIPAVYNYDSIFSLSQKHVTSDCTVQSATKFFSFAWKFFVSILF